MRLNMSLLRLEAKPADAFAAVTAARLPQAMLQTAMTASLSPMDSISAMFPASMPRSIRSAM